MLAVAALILYRPVHLQCCQILVDNPCMLAQLCHNLCKVISFSFFVIPPCCRRNLCLPGWSLFSVRFVLLLRIFSLFFSVISHALNIPLAVSGLSGVPNCYAMSFEQVKADLVPQLYQFWFRQGCLSKEHCLFETFKKFSWSWLLLKEKTYVSKILRTNVCFGKLTSARCKWRIKLFWWFFVCPR